MNVDASSSSQTAAAASDVSTNSTAQSKSVSKKSDDASFEKELKAADTSNSADKKTEEKSAAKDTDKTTTDKKTSENESNKLNNDKKDDLLFGLNTSVNFTDFKYHNEGQSLLSKNIQELINTKDLIANNNLHLDKVSNTALKASISYENTLEMSDGDALFFADLVKNTENMSMQTIAQQVQLAAETNVEQTQKSVQVSSVLMEKLSESMKTNQPFRIDFDKDVSVIIKVNKDGSLTANFIPGDKAVEQYLKNNISFLKQRFDEQNLPYSDLSYSNSRQQQQEEQRRRNNKENGHE